MIGVRNGRDDICVSSERSLHDTSKNDSAIKSIVP